MRRYNAYEIISQQFNYWLPLRTPVMKLYTIQVKSPKCGNQSFLIIRDLSPWEQILSFKRSISFFILYILPDPLSSIIGRCTLSLSPINDKGRNWSYPLLNSVVYIWYGNYVSRSCYAYDIISGSIFCFYKPSLYCKSFKSVRCAKRSNLESGKVKVTCVNIDVTFDKWH